MRKIWIIIGIIVVLGMIGGCTKVSYTTVIECVGPNWTSDNKIEFFKVERVWKHTETFYSGKTEIVSEKSWLCEINKNGTGFKEIGLVFDDVHQWLNRSSSAGDWVVFDNVTEIDEVHNSYSGGEIWVIKRDGTGLKKIGEGLYPDFSPDASKIVYQKPNQGIWIMNRDGSGDHCIVSDSSASYPAWSPDDTLIAYGLWWTHIITLLGDSVKIYKRLGLQDWGPKESNSLLVQDYYGKSIIVNVYTNKMDTLPFEGATKWSPDGEYFIGRNGSWWVCKRDGTNKWYLKNKIGGKR